ncbi:hypothetical protein HIDPHFAB_03019 [Nocardioides sp. T2.26MG-1]|nr:hypothetical protein HIDPHFAB_03019 [Nocardioides sp. T2.26MG-1]
MGRTTGLLLGAGLAIPTAQLAAAYAAWLWWRHDIRRTR